MEGGETRKRLQMPPILNPINCVLITSSHWSEQEGEYVEWTGRDEDSTSKTWRLVVEDTLNGDYVCLRTLMSARRDIAGTTYRVRRAGAYGRHNDYDNVLFDREGSWVQRVTEERDARNVASPELDDRKREQLRHELGWA